MKSQPAKKAPVKNKFLKILLVIFLCILAILSILPLFLNPIADGLVKQQVAAIFGDQLKIGSVNLSFYTGASVKVQQITLQQPPGFRGDLLKADSISVRVALMPLLRKQLLIYEIAINNPEIRLVQTKSGDLSLDYYLAKFSGQPDDTPVEPGMAVRLNQFTVRNAKIIFSSYSLSNQQPTFVLTKCNVKLRNLELPNPDKISTEFELATLLGIANPAKIKVNGSGVFGTNSINFTARSTIDNLPLPDYDHLIPDASFTIKSGKAWVVSNTHCKNNYLYSIQHVKVKDMKLTAKKGHALDGALLGVPANLFMKFLEDEKGAFDFDFSFSGNLNDLKANVKVKILEAISQSISKKLGLGQISNAAGKAVKGVKKAGSSVVNAFKGIFKKKK